MENEKQILGFTMSYRLVKLLESLRTSDIICLAIHENINTLDGFGWVFFDFDEDGSIVCANEKHKITTTVCRWAQRLLSSRYVSDFKQDKSIWEYYGLTQRHLERFGNLIKGHITKSDHKIEIHPATEIPYFYNTYTENKGRLADSCMNGRGRLFSCLQNNENVEIVTITNDKGMLQARALLWNVDIGGGNTVKFLDRFHTSRDYLDLVLCNFAAENNFFRKTYYNTFEGPKSWTSPTGEQCVVTGTVRGDFEGHKRYPFLDTFAFGGSDFISNDIYNAKYFYQKTNGKRESVAEML